MRELEKLCRPLIRQLCQYRYYARCGTALEMQVLDRSLREELMKIREAVEDDGHLKREFSRIEQPLVFFIDYTVKEGNFPFSREWREIARDYNELSGDEKFFEQLADNLDDPDSSERLMMFYLFMGLGFDGCHDGDHEYIQRRMKVCSTRFPLPELPTLEQLSTSGLTSGEDFLRNRRFRLFSVYTALICSCILMLTALGWNCLNLYRETGDFRTALHDAFFAAAKVPLNQNTEENIAPEKGENK